MPNEPQYRAGVCRLLLEHVEALDEGAEIVGRVGSASLRAIRDSSALAWIPARFSDEVADATLAVLKQERFTRFWAVQADGWGQSPLFAPIIEASRRIFGPGNPWGKLKWYGRAWSVTTRNLGQFVSSQDGRMVVVEHRDIPPSHRIERIAYSTAGTITGLVEAAGHTPDLDVDADALSSTGLLRFCIRW